MSLLDQVGQFGNQCVIFVQNAIGYHFPVDTAAQMARFVNTQTPVPGDIFVSTTVAGGLGHTGFVLPGGKAIDSNWSSNYDQKVRIHNLSDIPGVVGYIDPSKLQGAHMADLGSGVQSGAGPSLPGIPNPLDAVGAGVKAAGDAIGAGITGSVTSTGHGITNAISSALHNVEVFASTQAVALFVAAIVVLVVFMA